MADKPRRARIRVQTPVGDRSRTKQSFKDQCDVNIVVKRYATEGVLSHAMTREPSFGDFTHAEDLHAALTRVRDAQTEFDSLSSDVRKAADNDPVQLLHMLADEDGAKILQEAGMELGLDLAEDGQVEPKAQAAPPAQQENPVPNNSPAPGE